MKFTLASLALLVVVSVTGCGGPSSVADLNALRTSVTSYEMTMNAPGAPTHTQLVKLVNGEMAKMKMTMPGGWTLMDFEKKETITVMGGMAMKMPLQQGQGDVGLSPKDLGAGTIVGSETVDGVDCTVVQATVDGKSSKAWIGTADGLVRKAEGPSGVVTMTYSRINAVPDTDFAIPADLKVRDMGGLMKGLQKMGQ